MAGRRTLIVFTGLALLAASCSGSTVDRTAGRSGSEADAIGSTKAGAKTAGGGTAAGGSVGSSGTAATGNGVAGAAGGGVGGKVAGSTAPIRVAFVLTDTGGVAAYTGADFAGGTDVQRREAQALVDWANDRGGVNGRKVIPNYYAISLTASDDEALAACTKITEDDHNQVVIDTGIYGAEKRTSCFTNHRINYIGGSGASDRASLDTVAPFISTTNTSVDRQMKEMAPALKAAGYFAGARLGIFADDSPAMRRNVETVLVPALSKVGVKPLDIRYASIWDGTAQQQSQAQAQNQNAVLSFKTKDVNRVISFNYAVNFLGFSKGAQSQNYYPRYAFPEFSDAPGAAVTFGDKSQLKDAVAVSGNVDHILEKASGSSGIDRDTARPGLRRCLDIMSKELKTDYYKPETSGESGYHHHFCDHFLLFLDGARKLGTSWVPATLGAGLKLVGSYPSPLAYATDFSTGHMDGASAYATAKYNSTCNCFVRSTPWTKAPQ